jgi:Protein of unknown function (DUF1059)
MFAGKTPRCDCGYRLKARGEEEQVAEVRRHALQAHGIDFSAEEALAVLLRAELEPNGDPRTQSGEEEDE